LKARRSLPPGKAVPATAGDAASVAYGPLPFALFEEIRTRFIAAIKARRAGVVLRSE
jgi:hypothetical protein